MKAKVSKLIARRRRRKFSGFLVPYAEEKTLGGLSAPASGARGQLEMAVMWTIVAPDGSTHDIAGESALSAFARTHKIALPNLRRHLGHFAGNGELAHVETTRSKYSLWQGRLRLRRDVWQRKRRTRAR